MPFHELSRSISMIVKSHLKINFEDVIWKFKSCNLGSSCLWDSKLPAVGSICMFALAWYWGLANRPLSDGPFLRPAHSPLMTPLSKIAFKHIRAGVKKAACSKTLNPLAYVSIKTKDLVEFIYSKTWLKRTCSKADTCLRRTNFFSPSGPPVKLS